jgi:phospholipase/lecithinase/hemolysin
VILFKISSKVSQAILRISAQQIAVTALPIAVLITLPKAADAASFSKLYAFGDSLSDNGNVFAATGRQFPPFPYQQRFSNGPVWVEYLASKLNLSLSDFAFGGATTGSQNTIELVPNAPSQFPALQQEIQGFTANPQNADQNGLYVLWAGANDYLPTESKFFTPFQEPSTTVGNISAAVTSLFNFGARNFLVVNLPDLGKLPLTRGINQQLPGTSDFFDNLTKVHNTSLATTLADLDKSLKDINLISFDVNSAFTTVLNNPGQFGFTDTTNSCFQRSPLSLCSFNPNEQNKFFFWDDIHPTTATHKVIGDFAFETIAANSKPVPESSTIVGVLAFGAFLGSRSLRRKAISKTRAKVPVGVE